MTQPTRNDWNVDVPLTNISIAYQQSADNFIADKVFPVVPVNKRSDKYYIYTKNDWMRDEAEKRPPSTESAGSGYNISTDTYFAPTYAIHKDIDNKDMAEQIAPLDFLRDSTQWVTQMLMLRREIQWVADFFTTSIWQTDVTPGNLWSDFVLSDPITDIETGKETILQNTGFEPNVLVLGYQVWRQLKHHPDIVDRYKHVSGGSITTEMVAALLEIDRVMVAKAVKATNVEKETAVQAFTAGKNALLAYSNPTPSLLQPSAGYVFGWTGLNGGMGVNSRIRQFELQRLDSVRVEGEMAFDMKAVATDLGYFFSAVVA